MADTITILDGLTHAQFTADDATLFDVDSATVSAVATHAISIPKSASQCRVIFNQKYIRGALGEGITLTCRLRLTKLTSQSAPTKTENTQPLEWTDVLINTILETGSIDVSGSFATTLHIDCCMAGTAIHVSGMQVIVEIASEVSVDDAWVKAAQFVVFAGVTSIEAILPSNEGVGQTVISLTNPVANNFDNDGKFKFIRNKTEANSEIIYQISNSGDT